MTIANDIAKAFGNNGAVRVATTTEIVGNPGSEYYVHAGDPLDDALSSFGECAGASCHATAAELCEGVSRWVFDDKSEIRTDGSGVWSIVGE